MTDQFIGQTIAEKYRIDSVLREGNLGNVYHATHLLMDAPATVKILAPALAVDENITKRFSLEARTVSRIAHPNILNVKDFGSERNGATYIVYEGATGETLREAINRGGALSFERAARIARQIAAALVAAHTGGIIHRRLNSDNIFLAQTANTQETVKVLDFGAADETDSIEDGETKNLEYLTPEQNASIAEADERSDIYSLGVIFYEMLSGEVPFTADNPTDLLMKQANNPPAPLSAFRGDLPAEIEPIILRALAKNPEMRYQTAQEFVDDLDSALKNSSVSGAFAAPNSGALQANENIKNNLWKTAFVVLAGISLLAVALIYATSSKQMNPTTTLQADTNGQPVQPLNPATGMNEQGASVLTPYTPEMLANSNLSMTGGAMPQTVPNGDGFGDGYNPWARGVPPPGAPIYVPPGGQMIDPSNPNGSIFMPDGTVLVPVPANTSVNANVKPAATPIGKPTPAPANTAPQPTPAPTANPQATPAKPANTPAPKPTAQPAKTPAATERRVQSGREQDS